MQKALRYGSWAAIAVMTLLVAVYIFTRDKTPPMATGEPFGVPFAAVDHKGQPITEAAFRGRPSALFFGFTFCPEVCPTTLSDVAGWLDELGEEGKDLQVYFVTVDPERDTPEVMAEYVASFSDRIVGITGEPAAMKEMYKGFYIYTNRVEQGDDYTMDHSASLFLLDAQGRMKSTISYQENEEVALTKLRNLLK
ncbi:Cytochrome oxidase biogenesis protein Sco1/SenC/PrrC, thiol-disulfide reductase involved in Cu(I) insertion into CoxII Cu(A) center [hydrothermal vent metagenome]|uniref:Cytochrome oxidase biogenesis protein Sco1/SenC/PrrC, thiol-disulfide reductase involved in Cu(I) insertion into CoxII Cu(A) center n=1 Tax=hydrothermal vent metagenome TaxID=652676 RepID=A0A3B0TEK2_9ZZZZ